MAILIPLQVKSDHRGTLAVMESGRQVPFPIQRAFVIAGLPDGVSRGAHAHRAQHQFLVATSGSFSILSDDGRERRTWRLDAPTVGLHAPPLTWLELTAASPGASLLVLCDAPYDHADYIHDLAEFRQLAGAAR